MKYLFSIFIIILFYSCSQETTGSKKYYYNIFDSDNNIQGYYKRVVTYNDNERVDSIFRYNKQKELQNTRLEKFSIETNLVKSTNGEHLLITSSQDSCYSHYNKSNNEYKTCYLGKSKLTLDHITYDSSFKFLVTEVITDGISNYKYFDDDFVLLRQEYKDGFLKYYRIDRVKEINNLN